MAYVPAEKVQYLALEGGGGKGFAYLGAIKALEDEWKVTRLTDRVKGISGASAGAITALFLAMGYTCSELSHITRNGAAFESFFDEPCPGFYRSVTRRGLPIMMTDAPMGASSDAVQSFLRERAKKINFESALLWEVAKWGSISGAPGLCAGISLAGLLVLFEQLKRKGLDLIEQENPELAPFLRPIIKNTNDFIYNLIWDRGLYLGRTIREFFSDQIEQGLLFDLRQTGYTGGSVNFKTFHKITQVDLVVSGCNVTKGHPFLFSSKLTPNFPVAEAVAISMNLPLIFKPIRVEEPDPKKVTPNSLGGLWVDGGILNNLPIHAFDTKSQGGADPNLRVLNPNILALRLTSTPGNDESKSEDATLDTLKDYLGSVLGTVLYPSSEGQLRTPSEEEQTIKLDTGRLSLLEFVPDQVEADKVVKNAYAAVKDYFLYGASRH